MDDILLAQLCALVPPAAADMIDREKPLTEAQKDTLDRLPWTCMWEVIAVKLDGSRIIEVEDWSPGRNPITVLIEPDGRASGVRVEPNSQG